MPFRDPEAKRRHDKEYYETHRERRRNDMKQWYARHAEEQRRYRLEHRERALEWQRKHRAENPAQYTAKASLRRQVKRKRVPWYDLIAVQAIYTQARRLRETGIDCHVDHIVPLRHKLVCGLHVQNNLQMLLAGANLSKGNRRWPDMPDSVSDSSSS